MVALASRNGNLKRHQHKKEPTADPPYTAHTQKIGIAFLHSKNSQSVLSCPCQVLEKTQSDHKKIEVTEREDRKRPWMKKICIPGRKMVHQPLEVERKLPMVIMLFFPLVVGDTAAPFTVAVPGPGRQHLVTHAMQGKSIQHTPLHTGSGKRKGKRPSHWPGNHHPLEFPHPPEHEEQDEDAYATDHRHCPRHNTIKGE